MKREELKDILQNSYSQEKWIKTLQFLSGSKNLLTISLEPKFVEIKSAKAKEIVVEVVQLGTLKTTDGITLPIFDVTLQNGIKIEYNRVGVNELLKTHILKDAVKGLLLRFIIQLQSLVISMQNQNGVSHSSVSLVVIILPKPKV